MPRQSTISEARTALEAGLSLPSAVLAPQVAASWQRCRALGLDPRASPRDVVVSFVEVKRRREEEATLRRLALAEMQLLYAQIAGSNFMIALGDRDGMVLDTLSDREFADSAAGRAIVPGSLWGEGERGTNALGLAARERAPVAIHGLEHYFSDHGHLSCMAAPILDPRGGVLGLLDASCSYEGRQQHTHALVRMAASQIENGLIFQESVGSFILAFHPRAEYLDTLSAGLVAIGRDGAVSSLNRAGSALLSGLPARIGCRFEDLFEARFGTVLDSMLGGGIARICDRAGSAVFMVCRRIGQDGLVGAKPSRTPMAPRPAPQPAGIAAEFVCEDPPLALAIAEIPRVLALGLPVHLVGETGSGKEVMARHIHGVSGRSGAFVALNCGAVPEALFASELFGHERGAFTGAREEGALGLARAADGGTLFLDEVAEMPLAAQATLLRFLDGLEVRAVGATKAVRVDVQIVSATNRDLKALVAERAFRADLYHRLNGMTIALPPLAARADFAAIVRHLLTRIAPGTAITDAAIRRLASRPWPGNVRELDAVLKRALVRLDGDRLDENAFVDGGPVGETDCCASCRPSLLSRHRCREIRTVYRDTGGNASRTARLLGLSRTTVYKHLDRPGPSDGACAHDLGRRNAIPPDLERL
ncbi:sigma-54-dependent Fis family transcriptional regulator [Segnochrobactrum spirostomi]|uniref:Sigma-54-dependent Fis family transcriptional regulator n=1 Tax=Segnochrobactrum spirostomi TaxID=2608987 RepID=A0A6A7Y685_9HYPH|nr:sigma-54-dependent Fis family transcriptional regulator [Segnochrobactrum spirostomi]MQT14803.1 sigma-54-dependent Fis family transcriptional regulator [Segnochrobactrum spirostomi]